VVDIHETPAVPPFDPQGDERLGFFIAGGLLILLGWGIGVGANVLLHALAPSGGFAVLGVYIGPTWGEYAWASAILGALAGAMGVVLLALGRSSPRGPIVLPGGEY
jgi:hypothetical protein